MLILKYLNRAYFISVLFVLALGFAGCSDSDDEMMGGDVAISLTKSTVGATEIAQFVDITCGSLWDITFEYPDGVAAWCSVTNNSGSGNSRIALQYTKNTGEDARSVVIRVISGNKSATALLTQKGKSSVAISLTKSTVGATEIAQFVDITCGSLWDITFEYPDGVAAWCSVTNNSGSGNSRIALQYTKNTGEDARSVVIRVTSSDKSVSAVLTQLGVSGGGIPPETGWSNWLEMPATTQQSNSQYVTHYTTNIKGERVRNFTLFFDTSEKIAYWVAYPHSEMYLGRVGRTDDFQPDPSFANNQQMASTINGYDRGHQIPSGDRTATRDMNAQTFYYSNMTPQLGGFNQKIWADLENKVRTWVSACDTLYVVTGAVLKTAGGNETVKRVQDKKGNSIAVPNYYFKVLLQLKFNNGNNRSYKAIGFWFNHQANSGSVSSANAVSVDDVERKTGFDFFTNLPEDIQNQLESKFAPQEWGL